MTTSAHEMMEMPVTQSIEQFFEDHYETILQAAYRVTGSTEDAEDVLQTIFTRLMKREKLPDLGSGGRSYFRRAAVNAALDMVRARKRRDTVPLEPYQFFLEGPVSDRPDEERSRRELRAWLRNALGDLGERPAEVFTLRFIEGFSNQEVAELLDTTPGSVAVTLHRARNALQEKLAVFREGDRNESV